ncbi:transcription elongation protein SprT [Spirillospora sp. NPDC047279]|uniref:transcription elongation protein SprT n=1 Tax=Spirillospora sp. NPDC047279 TaxID=3155478 RepID=UPI003401E089
MTPWFEELQHEVPEVYVSVSFPSTGAKGRAIGQCHYTSKDGRPHLLIHPYLDNPIEVLATLLHEVVHAALPVGTQHGPAFKKLATGLGLTGQMTATVPTQELVGSLAAMVLRGLGPYPHAALQGGVGRKKQTTRMIKLVCPVQHGEDETKTYTLRMTRSWIEDMGAPTCPCGEVMGVVA